MSGLPNEAGDDADFDFDLDDLDDEALQRLLDDDDELEEELRAIEALDRHHREAQAVASQGVPPAFDVGATDGEFNLAQDEDADAPLFDDDFPQPQTKAAGRPVAPPPVIDDGEDDLDHFELGLTPSTDELREAFAEEDDMPPLVAPSASDDADDFEAAQLDLPPVPRINIHAFCSGQRLTGLMERAAADRRLSKAHITIHSGDAHRAADLYSSEASPNLIILEGSDKAAELLSGLDRLATVCDPSTRVLVLGDINDIRLYRELMDRGVSDYLVRLRSPLQLISAIGRLYTDPTSPPVGKTFVFVGARGGSGSSSICHNVAWSLAEQLRSDTVLLDFDLAFGTASLDFEHDPSQGLAEALAAPERLDDVLLDRLLQKCSDRLSLFAAPNVLERDYDLPTESYETVIDLVRNTAPCVAIDLPHLWSGWARSVIQSADEIILTATPDLSSFRNAKNIVEAIGAKRINDAPPILVLNQVGVPKRPEVPAAQFEEALGFAPFVTLGWDPVLFGTAATNAQALGQTSPKHKVTQGIRRIAERLMGRHTAAESGSPFNLKSLFAKRS